MARLLGRWRIVEMDDWDRNSLDVVEPAYIELHRRRTGTFLFSVVEGYLDAKAVEGTPRPKLEFTWQGNDEGTPPSGLGWVELQTDGFLRDHILFHPNDDAAFRAFATGEIRSGGNRR